AGRAAGSARRQAMLSSPPIFLRAPFATERIVNLRHLEVFCTVVRCESFSAAAEQLIMTQPAVSMQVQAVERHFGVQLLERRNRRTVPTEAGTIVYEWARETLKTEGETRKLIDGLKHAQ